MKENDTKKLSIKFDFKTRHAGISALIIIAVLAILIIANILVGELSLQADLTPKKLYSLTDTSKTLLDSLGTDIEIIALYEPGKEPEDIMQSVNEYEKYSDHISISIVDPDRKPALVARFAEDNAPVSKGSIIVSTDSRFRVIPAMDLYEVSYSQQGQPQIMGLKVEQQVTSAIAYVTSGRTPEIYEITGHNETTLAALGYGSMLTQANYSLGEISLVREGIPPETALITLIGPRIDLSEAEVDILGTYLEEGGNLFVALDPMEDIYPNLFALLAKWDLEVINGLVIETQKNRLISQFGDNPFVFAPYLEDHEALKPLKDEKSDPVFQAALGFRRTQAQQRQIEYFPLLSSSKDSWIRTDLKSEKSGELALIPGDSPGPVNVVAAIRQRNLDTYKPEGASIIAMGSASSLKGLGYLGQIRANAELMLNLINWVVDDAATVNLAYKSLFKLPLRMSSLNGIIYAGISIILIPLFCIAGALFVHFRRRHK